MRVVAPHVSSWTNTEELLAALVELVDYGNRLFVMAHAKKGSRPPKPIEIRRPGDQAPQPAEASRRRPATGEEMRRFFTGA